MAANISILVFGVKTTCGLVGGYQGLEYRTASVVRENTSFSETFVIAYKTTTRHALKTTMDCLTCFCPIITFMETCRLQHNGKPKQNHAIS
jgi:predicted transporter